MPTAPQHKTQNDLAEIIRSQSVELLNRPLTDILDLQSQTNQAHWNVIGPNFIALHELFGEVADGTILLCLHQWGAHEYPTLMSPEEAPPGNGLLLFFRVDDFDMALKRARALVSRFEEEPHVNPNTQTRKFSPRDPDGYYVTISALPAP